jgi:hypothetical protein
LRRAAADLPPDAASDRIGRADIVLGLVLEERTQVAERGEADPEHVRVLRHELDVVRQRRVEAVAQADPGRVRRSRNGFAALQLANAQSPLGTVDSPPTTPSFVSDAWVISVACVVSSEAGT